MNRFVSKDVSVISNRPCPQCGGHLWTGWYLSWDGWRQAGGKFANIDIAAERICESAETLALDECVGCGCTIAL